jgi:hypothetical protein
MIPNQEILDIIDLADYDRDFDGLYRRLKGLWRDRFEPHQKIVIHHYELEFFYHGHITGITTHNFMTVVTRLNISLSVFVIFTTYARYHDSLAPWITDPADQPDVRVTLAHPVYADQLPRDASGACGANRDIKYHALCIMGRRRPHKELLLKWMMSRSVLDRIQVNFNTPQGIEKTHWALPATDVAHSGELNLVYTVPHRGCGFPEMVPIRNPMIAELQTVEIPPYLVSDIIPPPTANDLRRHELGYPHDFFRWVGFAVVVETVLDNHHQFPVSEKIMKSLITQTPFVLLGAHHLLARLREHGFKTFQPWWDESYDDIRDPQDRFVAVCQVIEHLVSLPIENIRSMYRDMLPVLEHNQNCIIDYVDNQLPRQYNGYWNA